MQLRLILLLPFLVYLHAIISYSVNIPYWDDYSVVLMPAAEAAASGNWSLEGYWFRANAGHIPLLTHMIAWIQIQWLGEINFRWAVISGNVGLLLTVAVLVAYGIRKSGLTLALLLPVPFLLLSFAHWEAMDFMVPAWQFYWGSCLFPLLLLIAAVEGAWVWAAVVFFPMLFLSSVALAVYPLVLIYALIKRAWRGAILFAVGAGASLLLFFHYLPSRSVPHGLQDLSAMMFYVLSFMGGWIPFTVDILAPMTGLHAMIGAIMLFLAGYWICKSRSGDLYKLLFVYTLILAVTAVLTRGHEGYMQVPSRYSVFALLAFVSLYLLGVLYMKQNGFRYIESGVAGVVVLSMILWTYAAYSCRPMLEQNRINRVYAQKQYQAGNESALASVVWDVSYGKLVLERASITGIYRYQP